MQHATLRLSSPHYDCFGSFAVAFLSIMLIGTEAYRLCDCCLFLGAGMRWFRTHVNTAACEVPNCGCLRHFCSLYVPRAIRGTEGKPLGVPQPRDSVSCDVLRASRSASVSTWELSAQSILLIDMQSDSGRPSSRADDVHLRFFESTSFAKTTTIHHDN